MTAPATRTATDLDISDCTACLGTGEVWPCWPNTDMDVCPDCGGDGERRTLAECCECSGLVSVLWSVDHTLASVRCDSCAAVCNETAARVAAGRR